MNTLEEIRARKEELHAEIQKKEEMIASTWESLWVPTKANSKGEMVTHIIANSITAIDAFLTMRKLISRYGHLFGIGRRKKKRSFLLWRCRHGIRAVCRCVHKKRRPYG